jgi:hypothetical protein
MLKVSQLMSRRGAILGAFVMLAVVAGAVLLAVQLQGAAPAPQQVHVSIIGNQGGTVMVDGGAPTRLDAYDGTDARDFTASKAVSVIVDSSGMPPSCSIVDQAGKQLASEAGPTPSTVLQTTSLGYGPAGTVNAPTTESVTCYATLG